MSLQDLTNISEPIHQNYKKKVRPATKQTCNVC